MQPGKKPETVKFPVVNSSDIGATPELLTVKHLSQFHARLAQTEPVRKALLKPETGCESPASWRWPVLVP